MDLDQSRRVHPLALPERWNQRVERAESDKRDPSERAGVDVADCPVRIVGECVHRPDRHERAFKGRKPVEHRAAVMKRSVASSRTRCQAPLSVRSALPAEAHEGTSSMTEKVIPSV